MHDPLNWLDDELARLAAGGLLRKLAVRSGPQSGLQVILNGESLANFGSNDYLGIAASLSQGNIDDAVRQAGWGAGASPLIIGRGEFHARLEAALAKFEGTAAALLFPTGFAANAGTIAALVGPGDVVFSDALNHASLIDGCRLSGAQVVVYRHCDVAHLRELLAAAPAAKKKLIVTDSLFSMDGDLAPLVYLTELAEQHRAMLMVDEAHATGVFGANGRGVSEHLGVEDAVHIRVGTLSKALGSMGGFVAGQQRLIDWLTNRARTYFFSTACPEAVAAAGLAALSIVQEQPQRRIELLARASQLREQLRAQGWPLPDVGSQIIPLRIGDAEPTMRFAAWLRDQGFFVPGIRPPSVPAGQSLLRLSLTWQHDVGTLSRLLSAVGEGRKRFVKSDYLRGEVGLRISPSPRPYFQKRGEERE
ncbi:8-amino-7-oxononanoate synthase [Anatilimnocola aggregata]|uniref:8-amino-7-oxononanoate synthase n=1 Tax=Anatilimnocola aggregata TaxID=2528021 RepID=A0A517Y588_9BACT|nr:8-amino-7-oxononanoate synthase [Anatilimnocola aggregata]QDU25292.1 8-amino-7-oxononanoate synthase [Anatilimnocola aggregata]